MRRTQRGINSNRKRRNFECNTKCMNNTAVLFLLNCRISWQSEKPPWLTHSLDTDELFILSTQVRWGDAAVKMGVNFTAGLFAAVSTKSKPDLQFWLWKRMLSEAFRTRCFSLSGSWNPKTQRSWSGTRPAEFSSRLSSFRDVYVIYFSFRALQEQQMGIHHCDAATSRRRVKAGERLQTHCSGGTSANMLTSGSARAKGQVWRKSPA